MIATPHESAPLSQGLFPHGARRFTGEAHGSDQRLTRIFASPTHAGALPLVESSPVATKPVQKHTPPPMAETGLTGGSCGRPTGPRPSSWASTCPPLRSPARIRTCSLPWRRGRSSALRGTTERRQRREQHDRVQTELTSAEATTENQRCPVPEESASGANLYDATRPSGIVAGLPPL